MIFYFCLHDHKKGKFQIIKKKKKKKEEGKFHFIHVTSHVCIVFLRTTSLSHSDVRMTIIVVNGIIKLTLC